MSELQEHTTNDVVEELLRQIQELRGILFEVRTERDALKLRIRNARRVLEDRARDAAT
jgi:regulator of replication initiation timing